MKTRILILMMIACTALAAPAQNRVQDTFLGCRLGEDFRSVSNSERWYGRGVSTSFSKQDGYFSVNAGLGAGIVFGGQIWRECRYYFSDLDVLYKVRFYTNYSYEEAARARYRTVLKNLDARYPKRSGIERTVTDDWEKDMLESVTFTDSKGRSCRIELKYKPSVNRCMYYYVIIYYTDEKLLTGRNPQYMEEL